MEGTTTVKFGNETAEIETSGNKDVKKNTEEIPESFKFNLEQKSGSFVIDNHVINCKVPTISQSIEIESRKVILSKGQYNIMALSSLTTQDNACNLVDAVSTLPIVCTFPEDFHLKPEKFADYHEEEGAFLISVYKEWYRWLEFFRSKMAKRS